MASKEPETLYSCEICGEEGLADEDMKLHMRFMHIDGAISCPFCELSDICADEMYIHVNKAHLDYLSPSEETKEFVDFPDSTSNVSNLNMRPSMSLNLNKIPNGNPRRKAQSPAGAGGGVEVSNGMLSCPICGLSETSSFKLQEHVNRQHFDPTSPSPPFYLEGRAHENDAYCCPLCARSFESCADLELHVNIDHRDILSPPCSTDATPGDENCNEHCPICFTRGYNDAIELAKHIDEHFEKNSPSTASLSSSNTVCSSMSQSSSKDNDIVEEDVNSNNNNKSSAELCSGEEVSTDVKMGEHHYITTDEQGNFHQQSITNMQKAVYSGELSVSDYYTRKVDLRISELNGVDDGHSCIKGLLSKIQTYSMNSNNIHRIFLCSNIDHYGSTYGDRGWGCGYRNIQMLLSSLMHHTGYNQKLFNGKNVIPSISKLQDLIERAWQLGFDPQGCEQLSGRLVNTRKWIGATEVVTFLSSFYIRCKLLDCHKPTGSDGTHPDLFSWVLHYFQRKEDFKAPLYLQHQGHSRAIIGIEQLKDGSCRLLIFDPSHSKAQMNQFNHSSTSLNAMRLIRRPLSSMKAKQYQIVSISGMLENEQEYQNSKMLHSIRIPADR